MMNNIAIHILQATGRLDDHLDLVHKMVSNAVEQVNSKLELHNIDYVIQDNPDDVIPEIGVCGNAFFKHIVNIDLDAGFKEFPTSINTELLHTIAHESHHAIRLLDGPGHGETLFDSLIAEGLADHFARNVVGKKADIWSEKFYKSINIEELMKIAEKNLFSKEYNYRDWFMGSEEKGIPRCAGYALGFDIVGRYLESNPDETPAGLVLASSDKFKSYVG